MDKKEYLSEETYQKNKKKITKIAIVVLIVGVLIGGILIVAGLIKQMRVNSQYSEESKESLQEKIAIERQNLEAKKVELETERTNALAVEKQNLESKKADLEAKGIKYDVFAKYDDGESYDLKIITKALDPSFDNCAFDEYKNNALTTKYCSISNNTDEYSKSLSVINKALDSSFDYCAFDECKNNSLTSTYCSYTQQLDDFKDFNRKFESYDSIPFYMFGAFVIIASSMIAGFIYMFAKRREIVAFTTQQVMSVAKESIDAMAPTIGGAAGTIGKELAKGIKEGINEASNNKKE